MASGDAVVLIEYRDINDVAKGLLREVGQPDPRGSVSDTHPQVIMAEKKSVRSAGHCCPPVSWRPESSRCRISSGPRPRSKPCAITVCPGSSASCLPSRKTSTCRAERDQAVEASGLEEGVAVEPRGIRDPGDAVVAGDFLVGAEGTGLCRGQCGLVDVRPGHVPARREARFEEDDGCGRVGDGRSCRADDEVAGARADIDAVVVVSGVPEDAFVFFVEAVHRPPCERDVPGEHRCVPGQVYKGPGCPFGAVAGAGDGGPPSRAEVAVGGDAACGYEYTLFDVLDRHIGDRVVPWFVKQDHLFAVGYPRAVKADSHAAPSRRRTAAGRGGADR